MRNRENITIYSLLKLQEAYTIIPAYETAYK